MQLLKLFAIFLSLLIFISACSYKKDRYVIYNNHNTKQIDLLLANKPDNFNHIALYKGRFELYSFLIELDVKMLNIKHVDKKGISTFIKSTFSSSVFYSNDSYVVLSLFYNENDPKHYKQGDKDIKLIANYIRQTTGFKNFYINSYGFLSGDDYYISVDTVF